MLYWNTRGWVLDQLGLIWIQWISTDRSHLRFTHLGLFVEDLFMVFFCAILFLMTYFPTLVICGLASGNLHLKVRVQCVKLPGNFDPPLNSIRSGKPISRWPTCWPTSSWNFQPPSAWCGSWTGSLANIAVLILRDSFLKCPSTSKFEKTYLFHSPSRNQSSKLISGPQRSHPTRKSS